MAKVKKRFYCTQEKKTYYSGDDYTGKRNDLNDYLESEKKEEKADKNTKELKTTRNTKSKK